MIPYGKQDITQTDIEAVVEVLQSDYLTQGPLVPKFESALSSSFNSKFGIAVNSATSGLHIACLALGLSEGDIVWTSPISFVASANCALYCGASVDFVDIDPATNNMSIKSLTKKLEQSKIDGTLPKILIPVHLSGLPCCMQEIAELSEQYGFKIIEDASHAIGAKYSIQENHLVGSCIYSDITVFSFHPVKIITTAEGGLCCTNDEDLANKMNKFRSHGIDRNFSSIARNEDEKWNYSQELLGYNYRMTEMQAALGLSQFKRLEQYIDTRNKFASIYQEKLSGLPLQLPVVDSDVRSSFHLFIIQLERDSLKKRNDLYTYLEKDQIGVNFHYIPIYRHPAYAKLGFPKNYCLNSENYFKNALSIPLHQSMSNQDMNKVINSIHSFFQ